MLLYLRGEREMFILIYTGTNIPITQSVLLLLTRKKQDKKFSSCKWICFRLYSLWSVFPQGILTDWRSDWVSYCMIRSSCCSQLKIIHLRVRPHVRVMLMIGLHFIIGTNTLSVVPRVGVCFNDVSTLFLIYTHQSDRQRTGPYIHHPLHPLEPRWPCVWLIIIGI